MLSPPYEILRFSNSSPRLCNRVKPLQNVRASVSNGVRASRKFVQKRVDCPVAIHFSR